MPCKLVLLGSCLHLAFSVLLMEAQEMEPRNLSI